MVVDAIVGGGFEPLVVGDFIEFVVSTQDRYLRLVIEHIVIIVQAIAVAVPLGVVLGTAITYNDTAATVVIWLAGIMLTIPSIALFGLLIPTLGIGDPPVVFALILYSQLPVVRNTYVGLTRVDPAAIEAGAGLGMTGVQRLRKIKLPMALPVIMAGVRNAVVIIIGIAAIGAFIGAGGLGDPMFTGIQEPDVRKLVWATILLSALTLSVDYGFGLVEYSLRLRTGEEADPPRTVAIVNRWLPGVRQRFERRRSRA